MEYRKLPKGTEEISVIGFGGSGSWTQTTSTLALSTVSIRTMI